MIEALDLDRGAAIVDVGGGQSHLAGELLDRGYEDVTVTDASQRALDRAMAALGDRAEAVTTRCFGRSPADPRYRLAEDAGGGSIRSWRWVATALLAACLAAAPTPAAAKLVELHSGRHVYIHCRRSGGPTVVLVSGYHGAANVWSVQLPGSDRTPVFQRVARFTRVCAYDRPGTLRDVGLFSRSDPVPMPRTAANAVDELHSLLRAGHVPGPYVLAGHSLGGEIVRLYASTYPGQVARQVLVDALNERLVRALGPARWARYAAFQLVPLPGIDYPDAEFFDFAASAHETRRAAAARPLRKTLPMVVFSKGRSFGDFDEALGFPTAELDRAWRQAQDWLAGLVPNTPHLIARTSGHDSYLNQPGRVAKGVRRVVRRARRGL